MIKIYVHKRKNEIAEVLVSGHSEDFICNAVSAITQTASLGIHKVCEGTEDAVETCINKEEGKFYIGIANKLHYHYRKKIKVILETMMLGLTAISNEYPDEVSITWR